MAARAAGPRSPHHAVAPPPLTIGWTLVLPAQAPVCCWTHISHSVCISYEVAINFVNCIHYKVRDSK